MNTKLNKIPLTFWVQSTLHSYSLIFFSLNNVFAATILLVTFFNPGVGLAGLLAVVLTNLLALISGFNKNEIGKGFFGFNALFLGLALGYEYKYNSTFLLFFVTGILMLIMITAWLNGFFSKHYLPFLSFPFLITYWILSVASGNLSNLLVDEQHVYTLNDIAIQQRSFIYYIAHCMDQVALPDLLSHYFRTLAGTFFQNSIFGGLLISLGLLYFSRIAFSLSLIGFVFAYYFYVFYGADTNDLNYHLLGSNFIFIAIAIGCFYFIPNIYSYLTVIILIPVLMIILIFFIDVLEVFHLKAYTFPFSVLCTAFLFSLNQRINPRYLNSVIFQYFSPEKTIYKYLNSLKRFKNIYHEKIALPFFGEWFVSQGYNGKITHLGDWSQALDFVIQDWQQHTYKNPGISKEDFYCYNKPILAPLNGYVYDIINTVEDNLISEVDTEHNWGNSIIINHQNGLFSQISHIKKDSFVVPIGAFVNKGDILATCGNSGRSPEPHIHFQMQTSPTFGAKTIPYPLSYFIERKGNAQELKIFEVPEEGSVISNVQISNLLKESLHLIPGKKLRFKKSDQDKVTIWEVFTDAFNKTYLYCAHSDSYAYFVNDGTLFYFTDFEGDRKSLLFQFYLAYYKVLLGYYQELELDDQVPLIYFNRGGVQWIQDFVAPFYLFTSAKYQSYFVETDNTFAPDMIKIKSRVENKLFHHSLGKSEFELVFINNSLYSFSCKKNQNTEVYLCVT